MAKGRVSVVVERCKACGFCVEFCPTHVLALSSAFNSKGYHPPHVVHPEECNGCDLCGICCSGSMLAQPIPVGSSKAMSLGTARSLAGFHYCGRSFVTCSYQRR